MGASYIDYLIADRVVVPTIGTMRFPKRWSASPTAIRSMTQNRRIAAITPSRSNAGLRKTGLSFAASNSSYKSHT